MRLPGLEDELISRFTMSILISRLGMRYFLDQERLLDQKQ